MQIDFSDTKVQLLLVVILIVLIVVGYMYFNKNPEPTVVPKRETQRPTPVATRPAPTMPTTPVVITPAPTTPAPTTRVPKTPAPTTPAPTTPAPTTPAPTTPTPTTPAPTTPAPTTPSVPHAYINYEKSSDIDGKKSSVIFRNNGSLSITKSFGSFTIGYEIQLRDGKLHLITTSTRTVEQDTLDKPTVMGIGGGLFDSVIGISGGLFDSGYLGNLGLDTVRMKDNTSVMGITGSIRAENELEAIRKNISKSLGYLGMGNFDGAMPGFGLAAYTEKKPVYLVQIQDYLYIGTSENPTEYRLYDPSPLGPTIDTLPFLFLNAVSIPGILMPFTINNLYNGSKTQGKGIIWTPEDGSEFRCYYGITGPGNGTLTFVKYPEEFKSTPTLKFLVIQNKAEFTEEGGSHNNRSGWAYDSNGGSGTKANVMWFAYGN
jgi:hypothetical protein